MAVWQYTVGASEAQDIDHKLILALYPIVSVKHVIYNLFMYDY